LFIKVKNADCLHGSLFPGQAHHFITGLVCFLAAIDAEQIATQVATLNTVKAGIAAHRATLPA
jgi:hypothetical protein